jgi:hypothetical protein
MAFKQYTHCAQYEDFKAHWQGAYQSPVLPLILNGLIEALKHGPLLFIIGAAAGAIGGPLGSLIVGLLFAYYGFSYGAIKGFCEQWLNWRLICVQHDQCAVGRVAWIEPPGGKFAHDPIEWMFDNDLSFNLRLLPYSGKKRTPAGNVELEFPKDGGPDYILDKIVKDGFRASELLRKPLRADGSQWDLEYNGYEGKEHPDHPGGRWTLHCEIEGNGMQTLYDIAKALAWIAPILGMGGAVAGAIAGAAYGAVKGYNAVHDGCKKICKIPIVCDVVCFVAAAVAGAAAAYAGAVVGAALGVLPGVAPILISGLLSLPFRDNGNWQDVDPDDGEINEQDCVVVLGDHVYDAGHPEGWVEIHPVKHMQRVCPTEGFFNDDAYTPDCCPSALTGSPQFLSDPFKTEVNKYWDDWCEGVREGRKPQTQALQAEPQNWWCLHPLVDGCKKPAEVPHLH